MQLQYNCKEIVKIVERFGTAFVLLRHCPIKVAYNPLKKKVTFA